MTYYKVFLSKNVKYLYKDVGLKLTLFLTPFFASFVPDPNLRKLKKQNGILKEFFAFNLYVSITGHIYFLSKKTLFNLPLSLLAYCSCLRHNPGSFKIVRI